MVQSHHRNGRTRYGPDIARKRRDDGGRPVRDPEKLDSLRALSKRYGINPKTVAKWKKRTSARGLAHGSAHPALDGAQHRRRGGDRPRFAATERCRWTIACTRFSRASRI